MTTKRTFWEVVDARWSMLNVLIGIPAAIASIAVPAWAVRSMAMFDRYAPGSWVLAGFVGLATFAAAAFLMALARKWFVRSGYDARLAAKAGSLIDPLAKTFERKRIHLGDFVLPSSPLLEGKTFIECEIVGPMNLLIDYGNRIDEPRYPVSDAIVLSDNRNPWNAIVVRNCTFRGCSFTRVTFMFRTSEYEANKHLAWLNWITLVPLDDDSQMWLGLKQPTNLPPPQQQPPPETIIPSDDHQTQSHP